jgi:hypothetical protein
MPLAPTNEEDLKVYKLLCSSSKAVEKRTAHSVAVEGPLGPCLGSANKRPKNLL